MLSFYLLRQNRSNTKKVLKCVRESYFMSKKYWPILIIVTYYIKWVNTSWASSISLNKESECLQVYLQRVIKGDQVIWVFNPNHIRSGGGVKYFAI